MKVQVTVPGEITGEERRRWLSLSRTNPQLKSPYFHPEFAAAVASARADARVAVLEDADGAAFFPFQSSRLGVGKPIGGGLSDYQAVIGTKQARFDARELVSASGLAVWEFDHLLAAQQPFSPYHRQVMGSPILDLSGGFEAYLQSRREAGAQRVGQLQRKFRKLERDVGGVEFVAHRVDHGVLDLVIGWKSNQCRRTGVLDFFNELEWTVPLVRRILETNSDGFSGMLSILYAGGRVVAAHLGMRTERSLHWWFPGYNPEDELAKYSPGLLLLLKVVEHAGNTGIQVVDLGKGEETYKSSFMTGEVQIAEGAVDTASLPAALWHARRRSEQWLRGTSAFAPLRRGVRAYRQLRSSRARAR